MTAWDGERAGDLNPGVHLIATRCVDKVASQGYFHRMRSVGIKVLENNLSEYIRLASQGETILVTDRDRVVAEITQPQSGRADHVANEVLADAITNGWITPPLTRQPVMPRQPVARLDEILADLAEDRRER
jgi:antitoxin (DNA-binding transcriptional repressor) of toxin-antitoxin stability system